MRKPGSVGIPVPLTEVEIVDVETGAKILPAGQQGEIRARGPQIMSGYRNLPQETAETLRGGWLYTGDIGELDADGYLYIRDRKKDMAIVGGYNVYPREVDEVLYAHPAVLEAAAVGVPDAYRGEVIRAYVVLKPEAQVSVEALLDHCRANLARHHDVETADRFLRMWLAAAGRNSYDPYHDLVNVVSMVDETPDEPLDRFVAAAAAQLG